MLTHGVGPMRKYCIGAFLLDLSDPAKVIGRLREPLIIPNEDGRGTRLLDLAIGPGYVAGSAFARGCSVVAVDFCESMIALAKGTQSKEIKFEIGDAQNLDHANASFDAAVMNFGILHLSYAAGSVGGIQNPEAWRKSGLHCMGETGRCEGIQFSPAGD